MRLNGKVIRPGSTLKIRRGSLHYPSAKARTDRQVTLQQPGLTVTATQRYFAKRRRYATWLDVTVTLTKQPLAPVSGVLGRSLSKSAQSIGTAPPLMGYIAAQA